MAEPFKNIVGEYVGRLKPNNPGGITALWLVHGPDFETLYTEAKSDAIIFGIDTEQLDYELRIIKATPTKIEGGRVETWKAWAVIKWGDVDYQLVLSTIFHEEQLLESRYARSASRQ